MAHENCDTCQTDYDFTKENATLNLFIEDKEANFIEATCPNCQSIERIYLEADAVLHIISTASLGFSLHARADDDTLERAANAWNDHLDAQESDDLPELPNALRVQLYDDLRNWKGVMP